MAVTIENLRSLPDPQRAYKFNMIISKFPGGSGDAEGINVRCVSSDVPSRANEKISINTHGHDVHWHGKATYSGTINLVIHETEDLYVQKFKDAWQEMHWATNEGEQFTKAELETPVTLELLDAHLKRSGSYELIGCWIENVDSYSLSGDGANVEISVTLSYDYYKFTANK